jgi:hypothetical protein
VSRTWVNVTKYPNKKIMILRDDGEVELATDESEYKSM